MRSAVTTAGLVPIAASLRGPDGNAETLHLGAIAVVDGRGNATWQAGDPGLVFELRSTAKPFQLLPFLLDGLDAAHGTDAADLAIMMASHSGEPDHVERVAGLLTRFGLAPEQLRCGRHEPYHEQTRMQMTVQGREPSVLHSNCSGKHAAMLAVCQANGWSFGDYEQHHHPLQRRIESLLRGVTCTDAAPLAWSVDGCSVPTWRVALHGLARAFAALAAPQHAPALEGRPAGVLLERLYRAGTGSPRMLAGSDRLDTRLMQRLGGAVFAKTGADGLYAMAVRPSPCHPDGLGIAIKVADGDPGGGVRSLVATRLLSWLDPDRLGDASALDDGVRHNNRGQRVGERVVLFR
jgi:L-asparaginase II